MAAGVEPTAQYEPVTRAEERQMAGEALESMLEREHVAAALEDAVLGSTLLESGKVAQGFVLAAAKKCWDALRGPQGVVAKD